MLVLTRKRDEMITIGSDIVIRVIKTSKGSVKIGIEAPASVRVRRSELAKNDVSPASSDSEADDDEHFEVCSIEALMVQN